MQMYALNLGIPFQIPVSLTLYPMELEGGGQVAFRGQYEPVYNVTIAEELAAVRGVFNGPCVAWGNVDTIQYGNIGFDDFCL